MTFKKLIYLFLLLKMLMEQFWTIFIFIYIISTTAAPVLGLITTVPKALECEYYNATECAGKGKSNCEESRRAITCDNDERSKTHGCFALWQKFEGSDEEILQYKGCFLNNRQCIGVDTCMEKTFGKRDEGKKSNTLFCCCNKDYCNRDFGWEPIPTTVKPAKEVISPPKPTSASSIIVFTLVPTACVAFAAGAWLIRRRVFKKPPSESQSGYTDEENILLDKSDSVHSPSITLVEVKASGRFGSVWKASMAGKSSYVAVKILPLREKASWKLEQEVYSLAFMNECDWILQFIEARNPPDGDNFQLWLVTEYLEHGSLYDYLKGNTLSWNELLKIAVTMCQGLGFLHEEIDLGPKGHKPAVAHRDLKSKNVLLRPDLTACLADFGLAHIFHPTKPIGTSYGQVGTRRYMAPEVLEGAVSFTRDNFQRIDMYACGLVLWELASRCRFDNVPVGEYRLPFEEFIGQQPTFDDMQDIVVVQRKRPTVQKEWLNHSGMCVVAEAMKDAWDQDAEARISASCIVERLSVLSNKLSVMT